MKRLSLYVICVMITKFGIIEAAKKEVLIRDKLVMVLCDQVEEYMAEGKMPSAIKTMPEKYKNFVPGSGMGSAVKGKPSPSHIPASESHESSDPERRGIVGGGYAYNEDGTIVGGPPLEPRLSVHQRGGRKIVKVAKSFKAKRHTSRMGTTLQEDFEECSKLDAECVLDLNDGE